MYQVLHVSWESRNISSLHLGSRGQVQSEKKSPEKYVFSKGTRGQAEKIFLSQEFNKVSHSPNFFHLKIHI